jgi:hypothetical protein
VIGVVVVVFVVVVVLRVAFAVHLFVVVLVAFQLRVLEPVDPSQIPSFFWLYLPLKLLKPIFLS